MSQAQQASSAQRSRQYSLQELAFTNVKSIGSRGSVLMLAVRFEEVVSRGAGAAVALFSGAVIREMYRTKILSVKVCSNSVPCPIVDLHLQHSAFTVSSKAPSMTLCKGLSLSCSLVVSHDEVIGFCQTAVGHCDTRYHACDVYLCARS